MPARAEDAAIVPVTMRVTLPSGDSRRLKTLALVIDDNPVSVAATFTFGDNAGVSVISTRVRARHRGQSVPERVASECVGDVIGSKEPGHSICPVIQPTKFGSSPRRPAPGVGLRIDHHGTEIINDTIAVKGTLPAFLSSRRHTNGKRLRLRRAIQRMDTVLPTGELGWA